MRSHPARRKLFAAAPTAFHPRPRWAATFNFRALPSMVGMVGAWVGAAWGSLRAHGEVRAHIAPCKLGTATPAAFHPRSSWVPDEIECRVLLELPYTNPTPTPATSLRHTMTAERQNRVVVLRSQHPRGSTNRPACGDASRIAHVIDQPVLDEDFFNYPFTAGLERKLAFLSRWRAPGSIAGGLRGVWVRAVSYGRHPRARTRQSPSPNSNPFGTYVRRWPVCWRRLWPRRGPPDS
jgi:hypothetical protein